MFFLEENFKSGSILTVRLFFFFKFIEKCHTRSKTKHLPKYYSHICHYERRRQQAQLLPISPKGFFSWTLPA